MSFGGILRDALCLCALLALAWLYHLYARVLPTPALAAAWIGAALPVACALHYRARRRRRAFLATWVAPESRLQRWLAGGALMWTRALLAALVLAAVLLVGLARTRHAEAWLALLAALPLLLVLRVFAWRALRRDIAPGFLAMMSWRVAALPAGVALLAALVAVAFGQTYPDFSGVSLERAVWHLVDREHARSPYAMTLLQLAAAQEGLRLWLAQQLMPAPGASLVQALGWAITLAAEALFAWSYLLACHGALIIAGAHERAPPGDQR